MPIHSIGLHVFLAINKFLTIDHLFKYIYICIRVTTDDGHHDQK